MLVFANASVYNAEEAEKVGASIYHHIGRWPEMRIASFPLCKLGVQVVHSGDGGTLITSATEFQTLRGWWREDAVLGAFIITLALSLVGRYT